jgi:hypothetical protein
MKLKRFEQFIAESKVNESSTIYPVVEENIFLIDGQVYTIMTITLEADVNSEEAEPEVGYAGGVSTDGWSIESIDSVTRITEPDVAQKCQELISNSSELGNMGIEGANAYSAIEDLVWNAESEEITGQALKDLQARVFELDKKGGLVDLTGSFEERCDNAVDRELDDWEPDEPDYDDYDDDRW